jgi:ribosomal protein S18 acetylase RimI-like enzyme
MTPHEAAMTLEWVTGEFMLRWLERVPGVTIERFGSAWGACAPDRPELDFHNTVHRLLPDDVEQVPRIVERYAAAGVRPWLELMPAPGFERLAAALREAGAHQVDFLGVFERELPAPPLPAASGIRILKPPPDPEEFSRVLLTGHGLSEDQLSEAVPLNVPMRAVEGASLYLATVDGRPAAAAALFVQHGIGHLANASTMPGYRGRGCQTALIDRRLRDAAAAGCSRASVVAIWDSQSHRNLARAGFRTAYTKAVWRIGERDATC